MTSDLVRRRLLVRGRVQGVFFRDSARQRARHEGVAGWARNREDGALEVVLEGPRPAVDRVAAFFQQKAEPTPAHAPSPRAAAGFAV